VFDSPIRENFYPLSLTRPTFDFLCGTRSLLENIERALGAAVTDLIVPKYLEEICKEEHPKVTVNDNVMGRCLALNALISPTFPLGSEITRMVEEQNGDFIARDEEGNPIFGMFENFEPEALTSSQYKDDLAGKIYRSEDGKIPLLSYPWQLVSVNGGAILKQSVGFENASDQNCEVLGSRLHVLGSAEIERNVTIDSREGDVVIAEGAHVESFSRITGPAFVGKRSMVKSAKIRGGTSIGEACRIAGELEDSIIFNFSNKNHDGFIGHSIVGSWVNLGALTTNSDLKNTYGKIKVTLQGTKKTVNTELNKVGSFIGDMAKSSIGTLIMSGKSIGVSSQIFGTVTDDVPSFTLYAKSLGSESREIYVESVIETQRRMMARRNITMSEKYADMIKRVHNLTSNERVAAGVKKGKFQF
jgi:UDP-N-acetylglucosamine diphosphorylase / glucose-1-phosphate thymidylyltransferase / UDP-N-acetylgalactosamine diphosphorylase / glucosamine-1-phosphate N-acetyltransferase / galactosamine-1-phosphate N-acetyltransferase